MVLVVLLVVVDGVGGCWWLLVLVAGGWWSVVGYWLLVVVCCLSLNPKPHIASCIQKTFNIVFESLDRPTTSKWHDCHWKEAPKNRLKHTKQNVVHSFN